MTALCQGTKTDIKLKRADVTLPAKNCLFHSSIKITRLLEHPHTVLAWKNARMGANWLHCFE